MYSRKLALALAKQYRTCPPAHIRDDPAQKPMLDRHIAVCPYCADQRTAPALPWEDLVQGLKRILVPASGALSREAPSPGQLRPVRSELGRWRDRHYYNPPLGLIVDALPGPFHAFDVAQTYHDISLAGPGDLILTEDRLSIGPLFVECWNSYTLKADRLGPPVDVVTSDVLDAVKGLQKDSLAYPAWAIHPAPILEHDPRVYFREMEVETGYTFSADAAEEIVSEMETEGSEWGHASLEELRARVVSITGGVRWPTEPRNPRDVLLFAQLPESRFKLAASDSEQRRAYANLGVFSGGEMKEFRAVRMRIHGEDKDDQGHYTVDGQVEDLPARIVDSRFYCCLETKEGEIVTPFSLAWDPGIGSFVARFEPPAGRSAVFLAAVRVELKDG